jgi:small-conductance mechanosensitive channel
MIARLIIARLILVCFGTAVFIMALRRLRTYRLKERHMLLFLFTGLPFLVLAIWPTGVGWVAQRLHIGYQTVSLLCVVAFLILMVFEFLTIVSLQERRIATLAQIVGIMMEKHGMSDRVLNEPSSDVPRDRKS